MHVWREQIDERAEALNSNRLLVARDEHDGLPESLVVEIAIDKEQDLELELRREDGTTIPTIYVGLNDVKALTEYWNARDEAKPAYEEDDADDF